MSFDNLKDYKKNLKRHYMLPTSFEVIGRAVTEQTDFYTMLLDCYLYARYKDILESEIEEKSELEEPEFFRQWTANMYLNGYEHGFMSGRNAIGQNAITASEYEIKYGSNVGNKSQNESENESEFDEIISMLNDLGSEGLEKILNKIRES